MLNEFFGVRFCIDNVIYFFKHPSISANQNFATTLLVSGKSVIDSKNLPIRV